MTWSRTARPASRREISVRSRPGGSAVARGRGGVSHTPSRSSSSRHSSRVTLAHRGAGASSSGWRRVFFLSFAATLSCGLWRYSGVMFFLLSAISWPWHATLERMSANTAVLAQELRRRAESWRCAAASSARWIGSRRAQSRSSAVERAIWLADAAYSEAFRRKARDGRRAGTRVCACLITCCGPESCTF